MKVLILNSSDTNGGAARAAYRLHRSLLEQGVDSQMLVQDKIGDDSTVIGPDSKFTKLLAKVRPTIDSLPLMFYREKPKHYLVRHGWDLITYQKKSMI